MEKHLSKYCLAKHHLLIIYGSSVVSAMHTVLIATEINSPVEVVNVYSLDTLMQRRGGGYMI